MRKPISLNAIKFTIAALTLLGLNSCSKRNEDARLIDRLRAQYCGKGGVAGPGERDNSTNAIIGGQQASRNSRLAQSVVFVVSKKLNDQGRELMGFCSGTLVSQDTVLTAAHCVADEKTLQLKPAVSIILSTEPICDRGSQNITVIPAKQYSTAGWAAEPTDVGGVSGRADVSHDIALVRMNNDAPAGYVPMTVEADKKNWHSSDAIYVSGYGRQSDTEEDDSGYSTLLKFKKLTLASYQSDYYKLAQPDGGACFGDSGGPSMLYQNGKLRVFGVASEVVADSKGASRMCSGFVYYTSIAYNRKWLVNKFNEYESVKASYARRKNPFKE